MTDSGPTSKVEERVARFLDEHGLEAALAGPLQALLIDRPGASLDSLETLAHTIDPSLPAGVTRLDAGEETWTGSLETAPDEQPRDVEVVDGDLELEAVLGQGGMGTVHRAAERSLARRLALKVLRSDLVGKRQMRRLFGAEAQITAQLAHPGIPPVHRFGVTPDGRPFFTMKQVHGRELSVVIEEVHYGTSDGDETRWNLPRLLEAFQKACEAVAYAHARGVVHCDLKPANIMLGGFGQVMVMDWGVARLVPPSGTGRADEPPVRLPADLDVMRLSRVAGTPRYMAPEQASGEAHRITPASDVYSLGVVLFEVLAGERPFGADVTWPANWANRPPLPSPAGHRPGLVVDDTLAAIAQRAAAPDPAARYADAGALADDLANWRDGATRREKALAEVKRARRMLPELGPLRRQAAMQRELARQGLLTLGDEAPLGEKEPWWRLEEEAERLDLGVSLRRTQLIQRLHVALAHAPELPAAHGLLAMLHHEDHRAAEARRDQQAAARAEVLLRAHDTGRHRAYLSGRTALEVTASEPVDVRLRKLVPGEGRVVPDAGRDVGRTPLRVDEVPCGSYRLELSRDGVPVGAVPVLLARADVAETLAPARVSVELPGPVAADEVWVPGGVALLGGRADAAAPAAVHVDAFIMRALPETMADLLAFLSSAAGRHARRTSGFGIWRGDWPATGVPWAVARDYAAWTAEQTGLPWRLPTEAEWEKAARGVDGRRFPWGDRADGGFAYVRTDRRVPRLPRRVGVMETDRSPYGVRDMAGNVRCWCLDPARAEQPASVVDGRAVRPRVLEPAARHAVRGGSFRLGLDASQCAARAHLPAEVGYPDVGIRLVRDA